MEVDPLTLIKAFGTYVHFFFLFVWQVLMEVNMYKH